MRVRARACVRVRLRAKHNEVDLKDDKTRQSAKNGAKRLANKMMINVFAFSMLISANYCGVFVRSRC